MTTFEDSGEKSSRYKDATGKILERNNIGWRNHGLEWLERNREKLSDARYDYLMRGEVMKEIIDIRQQCEAEDVMEFDFKDFNTISNNPCIAIAREVITQMAIAYFGQLRRYLQAREDAVPDLEIEKIREKVAENVVVLLEELSIIIQNFKSTERTDEDKKYLPGYLHMLIDARRVGQDSGFYNVFKMSDIHHFEGTTANGASRDMKRNPYSGLRLVDVLSMWDPSGDVTLRNMEGGKSEAFAVIRKDGTVDVDFEKSSKIKSGMNMSIEKVPPEEQENLVRQITFSSGTVDVNAMMEILKGNDLLPKWMVRFGNSIVYLSEKLYHRTEKDEKRIWITIYMKDEKKGLVARSCYRSLSHAVWKLLPAYSNGWLNKGHAEEEIVLPPELQRALSCLCIAEPMKDAESVFSGMASSYTRADSFREEINATPIKLGTGFHHSQSRKKKVDPKSPDSFQFSDENDKPDFSEAVDSWTEEAVIYGITTFDVFRSRNNRLRYIFCRDSKERAWIAGIDIKDEGVTSQGIKKQWVEASDLCTPAFEYWKQTDGYENDDLTANQNQYVDMYANYIQYIPLVQEYQAWARAQVHITRSNKSGPNIVD